MNFRRRQLGYIGGGLVTHNHSGSGTGGAILQHVPAGTRIDYFGTTTPDGYLECDGQNVSRVTYAALFAAVGVTWGIGDGSDTFTLPDARRRVPVGKGGTGTGTLGNAVGNTGGEETHVSTLAETASHAHSYTRQQSPDSYAGGAGSQVVAPAGATTGSAGSDQPHNNIQPAYVCGVFIKT